MSWMPINHFSTVSYGPSEPQRTPSFDSNIEALRLREFQTYFGQLNQNIENLLDPRDLGVMPQSDQFPSFLFGQGQSELADGTDLEEQLQPKSKKGNGIRGPAPLIRLSCLYYHAYTEAESLQFRAAWLLFVNDATIPRSDAELRAVVLRLRDAMMDMTKYIDKEGSVMKNRWLDDPYVPGRKNSTTLTNNFYPPHLLISLGKLL